jgi:sn-glycerol-3-phosphate import ATP-binding protein ugpC
MANLKLTHVDKKYPNGYRAIQDVSINIQDGEFIVIVGPSGCGKSTLLRMVAGLEEVSSGEIKIGDIVVNNMEPAKRNVSMVFQNYALYQHMNVFDNMSYSLKIAKMPKDKIKERVQEIARLLGLKNLLTHKPKQLSGGQRQRVAMGRAIVRNPELFLFDEPLSNLDAKLRVQMRLEIKKLHKKLGVTSLYVTHDQVEAMTLADRIVVLNEGKIEQMGTPEEIFHEPASYFVADFMGSPPMNLFSMHLNEKGELQGDDYCIPWSAIKGVPALNYPCDFYLGIRPEHLVQCEGGLPMEIELVESLGSQDLIHLLFQGKRYVMNSQQIDREIPLASRIEVWVDHSDHLRYFDKQMGKKLDLS